MKARILVVEDDPPVCDFARKILTSAGYECRQACDGLAALAVLDSGENFDLLVSGLIMPGMGGMELFDRIRDRLPDIPFVIITGTNDPAMMASAYRKGVYDYVLKPFWVEQFTAAVRRALEYRRLTLENREYRAKLGL